MVPSKRGHARSKARDTQLREAFAIEAPQGWRFAASSNA
jgi:hypothetical protein